MGGVHAVTPVPETGIVVLKSGGFDQTAIILADTADYADMNAVWDEWVSDIAPPARACFNAALASPAMKVEMIMVSAVPDKSRQ